MLIEVEDVLSTHSGQKGACKCTPTLEFPAGHRQGWPTKMLVDASFSIRSPSNESCGIKSLRSLKIWLGDLVTTQNQANMFLNTVSVACDF